MNAKSFLYCHVSWDTLYIHVVCLYPINVKTAELIEPIFGNSHDPGKKLRTVKSKNFA